VSTGTGALGGLRGGDLRALVREVLRESLDGLPAADVTGGKSGSPAAGVTAATETVTLGTDADLDDFVRRLADLCEDPDRRAELRAGQLRFRLAPVAHGPTVASDGPDTPTDAPAVPVQRVERGAVTERHVRAAARSGARLVAAAGTVVTPLARDRARAMGVDIEKER
jgi:hypothetical protein